MSENLTNTYPTPIPEEPRQRRRRRWPFLLLLAVFALGFVGVTQAVAQHRGFGHHGGNGDLNEADVQEQLEHALGFMLYELNATESQEAEVDAIIERVAPSIVAFHAEGEALKAEMHELLSLEPIDAERVEALRVQLVDLVDRGSREAVDALLEVSDVLSVEQRTELRERIQRFHR